MADARRKNGGEGAALMQAIRLNHHDEALVRVCEPLVQRLMPLAGIASAL